MKRKIFFFVIPIFLILVFLGFNILVGCKKTDTPLGLAAPQGFDFPTNTPTPTSGAIEVFINVQGTGVQGVTVSMVDPNGVTLVPAITQPGSNFAPFNPPNLIAGIWLAEVPTQSVSYVLSPYSSPVTYQYYFFNSIQPVTITGSGQQSVTFTSGVNTMALSPVSQVYPTTYPFAAAVTASYNISGNLNVPVSCVISSFPTGISASPSSFIFDEGVTQQLVTVNKSVCYSPSLAMTLTTNDFVGKPLNQVVAGLYKNYSIGVTLTAESIVVSTLPYVVMKLTTTNDCGIPWNFDYSEDGSYHSTGTITNGVPVTVRGVTTNSVYSISSNIGSASGDGPTGVSSTGVVYTIITTTY